MKGYKIMSRNYSPRNFLRKVPNYLLKDYFEDEKRKLPLEIEWDNVGEADVEVIRAAIENLPEQTQTLIEEEFRQINDLACAAGVRCLLEEGESVFHKLELADTFREMKDHYERACWMYLNHPKVFGIAESLWRMDCVGAWRACTVFADIEPKIEQEDLDNLGAQIAEFYKKQGRGKHCQVDNYLRQNPERHCYFAYPEDYATTSLEYKEGKLETVGRKPAFEVIFVYKPESGKIETNAKGKKDDVKKLQEAFCQTILDLKEMPKKQGSFYDLSGLKDKSFRFVTDPKDGIDKVTIKMLQLRLKGADKRRIMYEADSTLTEQPVYALMEKALDEKNVPLDEVDIAKAKIQVKFAPKDGRKGTTITFEIGWPDRCKLGDDPLHQVVKRYLREWGLERDYRLSDEAA